LAYNFEEFRGRVVREEREWEDETGRERDGGGGGESGRRGRRRRRRRREREERKEQ
jgi:hypothetical protein